MKKLLKTVNWKVFTVLLSIGLVGIAAVLPYMFEILKSGYLKNVPTSDFPLSVIALLAFLQNGVILSVTVFFGMILSARVGLRIPLIHAWANRQFPVKWKTILMPGIYWGAVVGVLLISIEAIFFLNELPLSILAMFEVSFWKRLLAGVLYGGLTEELLMRLFLLSLAAWLLGKLWKTPDGLPDTKAFWIAIILVAVIFGLGHLPVTSAMTPLTPMLVMRALILNGIAGIIFGFLYWKYGLESAMAGHISAHLIMQIPGVMLLKSLAAYG